PPRPGLRSSGPWAPPAAWRPLPPPRQRASGWARRGLRADARRRSAGSELGGEAVGEGLDRPVGSGGAQLADRVLARRHADDADAGRVTGLDVARRVAHRDDLRGGKRLAAQAAGALHRDPGQLGALARVRPVAAEGEVVVQVRARELDVGRGLDVAGGEAEQDAALAEAAEQLLGAGLDAVAGRGRHLLGQVAKAQAHRGDQLPAGGLAPEDDPERLAPDLGVGNPLAGVLGDAEIDAVE